MSAFIVIKQRDRVAVVTDAACWHRDTGVVMGFGDKQASAPSLPAVFAIRGHPLATPLFAHFLSHPFGTFDALVVGIEGIIADVHKRVERMCSGGDCGTDVVFAGWSRARNRPEAYLIRYQTARCNRVSP